MILFLIPDLSMVGYLFGKEMGAGIYNLVHNYILAIILLFIGGQISSNTMTMLGVTLLAHVSLDRLLGFGLKYDSKFRDTHMQKV